MDDAHPLRIGIAGAGIGGLAAASLLARDGHQVTLFDQFDAPRPIGSGLMIQPVGQVVLEACRAAQGAIEAGTKLTRMRGLEVEHGRMVLDVGYARASGGFGLGIHRASLHDALLGAATDAGATLVASAPVTGSEVRDVGRSLTFDGNPSAHFDLVIDAGGASSPLSPLRARPLSYGAIWATVPWPEDTELPTDELTQRYERAFRMAGVLPIGTLPGQTSRQAAIFWSLPRARMAGWPGNYAGWCRQVGMFWPEFAPFLAGASGPEAFTPATYTHGSLWRPYSDRLVHIGDAAHRASPQLGQGANMALLDAYALAHALRCRPVETALPYYTGLRRWHTALYQLLSASFTPQYQSGSAWLPRLRDHVLAPISRIPPVPAILTRLVSGDLIPAVRGLGPYL